MAEDKQTVGRRRLRLVRLRPEMTEEALSKMSQHLSAMLGLEEAKARRILIGMRRPKSGVA